MVSNTKKGFTLIEMAIVLTILALVIAITLNITQVSYEKNTIYQNKEDATSLQNALIGYVAQKGRLPYPDINGDGIGDNTATGLGEIPYIDLQIQQKDIYGITFQYDVWSDLADPDITNFTTLCGKLGALQNNTTDPKVQNDDGTQSYSVAAVFISMGKDKILTGENIAGDRIYEMENNSYNETTNNDTVIEITASDLISRMCQ